MLTESVRIHEQSSIDAGLVDVDDLQGCNSRSRHKVVEARKLRIEDVAKYVKSGILQNFTEELDRLVRAQVQSRAFLLSAVFGKLLYRSGRNPDLRRKIGASSATNYLFEMLIVINERRKSIYCVLQPIISIDIPPQ